MLAAFVGAMLGFLVYNFEPASIFLGDSGSLVFGFVLATTAIAGWQKGATALASGVPLLIFALPLTDAVDPGAPGMLLRPRHGPVTGRMCDNSSSRTVNTSITGLVWMVGPPHVIILSTDRCCSSTPRSCR